jgi:hypothetical protein
MVCFSTSSRAAPRDCSRGNTLSTSRTRGFDRVLAEDLEQVGVWIASAREGAHEEAVVECIDDELELGVPVPVQGRAADFGGGGDVADRHVGIAVQDEASRVRAIFPPRWECRSTMRNLCYSRSYTPYL